MASLSIVIVSYNAGELLRRCLRAVGNGPHDVVVVDNASSEEQTAAVCADFAGVTLIQRGRNDGFGAAANEGIAATDAAWVLLLNPDAWPLAEGVDQLHGCAQRDARTGAIGPLLVDEAGRPSRSTIRAPLSPGSLALWAAVPDPVTRAYGLLRRTTSRGRGGDVRDGEFLQASALLLRREAFDSVGGFDTRFFMYGEDADLCQRLRAGGWTLALCPSATFVHVGGGSSGDQGTRMHTELLRSWLRLIDKRDGLARAERARRWLVRALRVTGQREAADWAGSNSIRELLSLPE